MGPLKATLASHSPASLRMTGALIVAPPGTPREAAARVSDAHRTAATVDGEHNAAVVDEDVVEGRLDAPAVLAGGDLLADCGDHGA